MVVDKKVLDEKVSKGEPLSKEEETVVLQDQGPVPGYEKVEDVAEEKGKQDEVTPKPEVKDSLPPKKEEKPKEETVDEADPFFKIERELSKPDGQADLKGFSDREKAYFHQMQRDRKARQKAEEERDAALFRETQNKKKEEKPPEPKEEDPIEELKKKDPTDFMTVADVVKVIEKMNVKKEDKPKEEAKTPPADPVRMRYLKMCDDEARAAHNEDYDAVILLTDEIVTTNPKYLEEVAKAVTNGENPALKTYDLIKQDPEFSKLFPVAKTKFEARKQAAKKPEEGTPAKPPQKTAEEIKKEQDAQKAQDALEKNKDKTKTTGHIGSADDKASDELSMEEVAKMSDREFAKLPRKTRQKYLELYG